MSQITRTNLGPNGTGPVFSLSDTANAKTYPDSSGNIQLKSSDSSVSIIAGTNNLDFKVVTMGENWVEITTSQGGTASTGYVANSGSLITLTLPATFIQGTVIEIVGKGAGLFAVAANTGDTISIVGPTAAGYTTSAGGTLTALDQYGHLRLIAITADTTWVAIPTGNFTVA